MFVYRLFNVVILLLGIVALGYAGLMHYLAAIGEVRLPPSSTGNPSPLLGSVLLGLVLLIVAGCMACYDYDETLKRKK